MLLAIRSFFHNTIDAFWGKNFFLHVAAMVSTYVLVVSGFDWYYFTHTQEIPLLNVVLFPAIVLGGVLPILIPPLLYVFGKIRKNAKVTIIGVALTQSVLMGSFISSLYKAFTGRIQPDILNTTLDISQSFQFGFLSHGIFWGWPSSHTTIAFAMAITLVRLFPKRPGLQYSVLLYACYIGIGISTSIHWFSEFVAGACVGVAIGASVGTYFRVYLPTPSTLLPSSFKHSPYI